MTVTQQQLILAWFGCLPPKSVDGIKGPQTEAAIKKLQGILGIAKTGEFDQNTEGEALNAMVNGWQRTETEADNFWERIRYWSRDEFRCRCGEYHSPYCDGFPAEPSKTLVELLDDIRAHFGRPAIRSSGLRCKQHNRDSGGVDNSRHLTGKAMDFTIPGIPAETVRAYAAADPRCSYTYAIDENYVHVDVD